MFYIFTKDLCHTCKLKVKTLETPRNLEISLLVGLIP